MLFPKLGWRRKENKKGDVTDERPGTVLVEAETVTGPRFPPGSCSFPRMQTDFFPPIVMTGRPHVGQL